MHKELLISILGLEANASDENISNAARTFQTDMITFKNDLESENERLQNAATASETRATAAEGQLETLKNSNKSLTEELVNSDLEKYKDVVSNSDEVKSQLLSNRAGTVAILKNIKAPTTTQTAKTEPLHNSKTAATPATIITVVPELSNADVSRISNRAREISKNLGLSHQQAWIAARKEVSTETSGTK